MLDRLKNLEAGKKVYFASDFHLGAPDAESSRAREQRLVKCLREWSHDAAAIVLAGDIFDFWFEYKRSIPKGFTRLLGAIANITDSGTPVILFTGNHDMWMFDYLKNEIGVQIFREPQIIVSNNKKILVGHGDGLGSGDYVYKILKQIFRNKICQWLFARIHPNAGIGLANFWSKNSRKNNKFGENNFDPDRDYLLNYIKKLENMEHHDYYIFGHRHVATSIKISETSTYINLGEWINKPHFAEFDGSSVLLKSVSQNR